MLFTVALCSSLLLSSVVLALPSGLGARIARRSERPQVKNLLERALHDEPNPEYSANFAGALLSKNNRTFSNITGTFIVPGASGTNGSSAAIFVGLDGFSCSSTMLATGITVMVGDSVTYSAWHAWLPGDFNTFPDPIDISAGDTLKLTANASSLNSATLMIENLTNGQVVGMILDSFIPLCEKDAAWGIIDYSWGDGFHPLADFGTVTITNATANGDKTWHPLGANIIDMKQNGTVLTNVTTDEMSVTLQYC